MGSESNSSDSQSQISSLCSIVPVRELAHTVRIIHHASVVSRSVSLDYTSPKSSKTVNSPQGSAEDGNGEFGPEAGLKRTMEGKLYHEGFLYKHNTLDLSGGRLAKVVIGPMEDRGGEWSKWWVELWGATLRLWRVPDVFCEFGYRVGFGADKVIGNEFDPGVMVLDGIKGVHEGCIFINIASCVSQLFPVNYSPAYGNLLITQDLLPPPPYTSFFALSTAGSNLYSFATYSSIQSNNWIAAIRLAHFEQLKINWIFSAKILKRLTTPWDEFGIDPFQSQSFRGDIKLEGFLQIKPQYSVHFKEVYCVVTSKHTAPTSIDKNSVIGSKLFTKKKQTDFSKRGSIIFYANKSKRKPLFLMEQCTQAMAEFPNDNHHYVKNGIVYGVFQTQMDELSNEEEEIEGVLSSTPFVPVTHSSMSKLGTAADPRPKPAYLQFKTLSSNELLKWIVAILGAFSIDSDLNDSTELLKTPEWPTPLYLSLGEISGIGMMTPLQETFMYFQHYLAQKISFAKKNKLTAWIDSIAKGEWERKIMDRKETELKLKNFFTWVTNAKKKLADNEIVGETPNGLRVVQQIADIMPGFAPALMSMLGDVAIAIPSSSESESESSEKKSSISNSDGSISDSGTSDGSISDEESEKSVGSVKKHSATDNSDSSEDEEVGGVYGKQSLLHQLATERPKTMIKDSGHLVNPFQFNEATAGNVNNNMFERNFVNGDQILQAAMDLGPVAVKAAKNADLFLPNSLLQRQNQIVAPPKPEGPLLGNVEPRQGKPKLQDGLLGVMNRREKEKLNRSLPDYVLELEERAHERGEVHPLDLCEQLLEMMKTLPMSKEIEDFVGGSLVVLINQLSLASVGNNGAYRNPMTAGNTKSSSSFSKSLSKQSDITPSRLSESEVKSASTMSGTERYHSGSSGTDEVEADNESNSSEDESSSDDEDVPLATLRGGKSKADSDTDDEPLVNKLGKTSGPLYLGVPIPVSQIQTISPRISKTVIPSYQPLFDEFAPTQFLNQNYEGSLSSSNYQIIGSASRVDDGFSARKPAIDQKKALSDVKKKQLDSGSSEGSVSEDSDE